jgi:hypothetical protein
LRKDGGPDRNQRVDCARRAAALPPNAKSTQAAWALEHMRVQVFGGGSGK